MGQFTFVRNLESKTTQTDLRLGTHQALTHSGWRDEECPRDSRGVQTENGLEHERRVNGWIDGRMSAHEQQLEPLVGKRRGVRSFGCVRLEKSKSRLACCDHLPMTNVIDQCVARGCQQPGARVLRQTVPRPPRQGSAQGLAEGVL